jgi:hypothetical protein
VISVTSSNQFGINKFVSCTEAIYCARILVHNYVNNGTTVNLRALDISKAFDKMNQLGLFLKLMLEGLPSKVLSVLGYWFSMCFICVEWMGFFF